MRGARAAVGLALLGAAALVPTPRAVAAQNACPDAAGPDTQAGWAAYGDGAIQEARARFEAAISTCPGYAYARTGLGYVELRQGNDEVARELWLEVVEEDPEAVDAVVGLGLEAWRRGDLDAVAERFATVERLDPGNPTATDYLSRLPEGVGPAPPLPPLARPDTLTYPARAGSSYLEIRTPEGWRPFFVKGINLGAALPGRNPSEFPDRPTYRSWIAEMAAMEANTIRVYTIHPPRFYEELLAWNEANPGDELHLIHGVWTELPEDDDYLGPDFEREFFAEMRRVVDLVHGRADIRPRPGHASGFYRADVSDWTLAWILGREWEPFSSLAFDSLHTGFRSWDGRWVTLASGNPMEAWLTRALDSLVAYETAVYHEQRPSAFTNWPTLDPLDHPTETTREEEVAIREALGEEVDFPPREYDNDVLSLDANRMRAGDGFEAGLFASYHAYPYYPDFMVLQPSYGDASSSFGPSRYMGYLRELKDHHRDLPVLVAEYGVPSSFGTAHLQPQGQHHGGLSEDEAAEINRRLTLELAEAGMAGGAFFAWIDEWFKKNWLVIDFELPPDRNRLWYNRLDAEQHYGVLAVEPEPAVPGSTREGRHAAWTEADPLLDGPGGTLRAAADPAYLWLRLETPGHQPGDTVMVGLDVLDAEAGDRRWPGAPEGPRLPLGLEFVVVEGPDGVRVVADPPVNPFRLVAEGADTRAERGPEPEISDPPPGFFRARLGQRFNLPYTPEANADGRYDSLRVISNRRRIGRDSLEYRAMGYDRGVLPEGPPPDGFWERDEDVLELRIPWLLVNVTDPSSRSVLASPGAEAQGVGRTAEGLVRLPDGRLVEPDTLLGDLGVHVVPDIGLVAGHRRADGSWAELDGTEAGRFTWPTWDEPEEIRWRARRRATFDALRDAFVALDTLSLAPPATTSDDEPGGTPEAAVPRDVPELRARADSAWNRGEPEQARTAYEALLELEPGDGRALHRLALMHAWEGETESSLRYFNELLARQPGNLPARVDRARVLAWAGQLDRAVAVLDTTLTEHPEHTPALEARATFLAWAGDFDASLRTYEQLLSGPGEAAPVRRQRAQVLSWASRYEQSRAVYDSLLAEDPDDREARLGLATTLTFSGDIDAAEEQYRRILEEDSTHLEALQGLGRAQSWDGRLVEGETTLRRAVALDGSDLSSLVGLARNLRWQGRNAAALELLLQGDSLSPGDPEVQEQIRRVEVNLAPRVSSRATAEDDSDGNRMLTTGLTAQWNPVPRLTLRADLYRRGLSQASLDREALGVTITAAWQLEPGWTVAAGGGVAESDGAGRSTIPAWRLSLATPGRYPLTSSLTLSSSALDATAALAERGVEVRQVEVDAGLSLPAGWRVGAGLGRAEFRGSRVNPRLHGSLSVSRRLTPGWTLGLGGRAFGFREDLSDGYFDPDFFGLAELSARWSWEPEPWNVQIEGAPGVQQVGSDGDPAGVVRVSGRIAHRIAPGQELWVSGGYSSAGLQSFSTAGADYRYTVVSAGVSWVF